MRLFLTITLAAAFGTAALAAASYHTMYARMGGYAGVSSISNDLVSRLAADPTLSLYFRDVTPVQRRQLAKYAADYACKEAGAGCTPRMPDIALVQNPPDVTQRQKDAAIADLKQTMAAHHVPADIRMAVLQAAR